MNGIGSLHQLNLCRFSSSLVLAILVLEHLNVEYERYSDVMS